MVRSSPLTTTEPEGGRGQQVDTLREVLLPAPLGPTTARISPASTLEVDPGPESTVALLAVPVDLGDVGEFDHGHRRCGAQLRGTPLHSSWKPGRAAPPSSRKTVLGGLKPGLELAAHDRARAVPRSGASRPAVRTRRRTPPGRTARKGSGRAAPPRSLSGVRTKVIAIRQRPARRAADTPPLPQGGLAVRSRGAASDSSPPSPVNDAAAKEAEAVAFRGRYD